MASLVLAGNTSGSITISSPAVAGSTTLTLPTTSGTVLTTAASQTLTTPNVVGPLTLTSGGITFNANAGGGTQATLSDYEIGTFTSTIGTTGTAFTNSGSTFAYNYYVKIGRFVQIWGAVLSSGSTSGGTGNVTINGLPFAIDTSFYSNTGSHGSATSGRVTLATGYGLYVTTYSATQLVLVYNTSGANPTYLPASSVNGNSSPYINFTISYYSSV